MRLQAKATMQTTMVGIDQATQQRIADAAYVSFVAELARAGFEVVGPEELARLAPEWASWTSEPNFATGRFGTYVAPKGYQVRFLQGDKSQRDTSSKLSAGNTAFRLLDRPQAWSRAAYVAHAAGVGIIGVTMVVDYGVYSSSASVREGAETGFVPGVFRAGSTSSNCTGRLVFC